MPTSINSVTVIEEALQALDALEEACNAVLESPFTPKLPGQVNAIRETLEELSQASQQHRIDQYLPKG